MGLGFNRDEPDEETPYPDAWCDDCEIIRAGHGGWNEKSEKLTRISLLCSGCYKHSRIRNTKTSITLADPATLRWKCRTCEEWHTGPCLDMGYEAPYYWRDEYGSVTDEEKPVGGTFLTEKYCAINDEHFFVRGIIQLPILRSAEYFCWGGWDR